MHTIITLICVAIAAGLLWFVVGKSPIGSPYKGWIQWVILFFAVIYVIGFIFTGSGNYIYWR